ncbi:MAG: VWA domain-containing protein [Clostridia bacterium]|nr:VWA domain-containing protein [Clostridia bacterium]
MPIIVNQGMDYNVDIVMCIDATGSMDAIIDEVKNNALTLYQRFVEEMGKKSKSVAQLRIKVIAFRDFAVDSEPLVESEFFVLNEDGGAEALYAFMDTIVASGGGDLPENSLEALAVALKSDWVRTGSIRRHVVMMFTDAAAIPLGDKAGCPGYPEGMPADIAELRDWWEGQEMESRAKRLLLFAPDMDPWSNMIDWTNTFHQASAAGAGMEDTDMEICINLLVNSI